MNLSDPGPGLTDQWFSEIDVVVFAPFAGVRAHARLERRVADALHRAGARVVFVNCSGLFNSRCVVMESRNLDPGAPDSERQAICAICTNAAIKLNRQERVSFSEIDITTLLDSNAARTSQDILSAFRRNPTPTFEWNRVPLGAYWCFETILKFKSEERTPSFLSHLEEIARSGSIAFAAAETVATKSSATVMVHSAEYGINRSFIHPFLASRRPVYSFRNAGQFSRWEHGFQVDRVDQTAIPLRQTSQQQHARTTPLVDSELSGLLTWFDDRIGQRAAHIYSSPRSGRPATAVRHALGLDERPVVVAFSSSPDERHAASTARLLPSGSPPFDPSEHYRFAQLVSDTAAENPGIQVVYRLHPRLAANKRESRQSPHLEQLIALLESPKKPSNLVINTPDQNLSMYELAMVSDVGLTWSSTAGLEFLVLGIPVVGIEDSPSLAYPADLNVDNVPGLTDSLSRALMEALKAGWSAETMRTAARWILTVSSRTIVPVSPSEGPTDLKATALRRVFLQLPSRLQPHIRRAAALLGKLTPPSKATGLHTAPLLGRTHDVPAESPSNRAPGAIFVGDKSWRDLVDAWVNWCETQEFGSLASEQRLLADFASHAVEQLAPWDGTEGAVRGIRQFAEGRGAT